MKEYTTSEPVFSDVINVVESTDPVNPECNNTPAMQLLQNTLALKQTVSQKAAQAELDTLRNIVNNKHSLIKKQLYPVQIQKYGSDSVLTSLSISAGSCSGLIYITFQENLNLKEISSIRLSWGTADDYPILINYCTTHNDNGVSLVMWNLGKSDFTITKSTRLDVIGWS